MIHARIQTHGDRHVIEFSDEPGNELSWTFPITFMILIIHDSPHFLPLDGDIDYNEVEAEPPISIEEVVEETIRARWPIPFPRDSMMSAAKDAWGRFIIEMNR